MKINTYQKKKAKNVRPNTWDKRKINTFEIKMRLNNKIASPEICHFPFFFARKFWISDCQENNGKYYY